MEQTNTLTKLAGQVAKSLSRDSIDVDTPIGELGFDSMSVVELLLICNDLYDITIEPESIKLDQFTTLRDLDGQGLAMVAKRQLLVEAK